MDRTNIRAYLAGLSEEEFAALAAEARAEPTPAEQLRAAEQAGDWPTAFRLKADLLAQLMTPKKD